MRTTKVLHIRSIQIPKIILFGVAGLATALIGVLISALVLNDSDNFISKNVHVTSVESVSNINANNSISVPCFAYYLKNTDYAAQDCESSKPNFDERQRRPAATATVISIGELKTGHRVLEIGNSNTEKPSNVTLIRLP